MLSQTLLAAEVAEKGGLFDFDATLPLIAIQFLLLVAVLNALFYEPVTRTMDGRSDYIRTTQAEAQDRLDKVVALTRQYETEISQARLKAQQLIAEAEAAAARIRSEKLAVVQAELQEKLEAARVRVEEEKQAALSQLQQQVDAIAAQITQKLLGSTR
ncbi:F0F1 ATP synthase subunit B' [Thermostichus vulcanus]|uniref:ATP synthase subunit b' n=1 Tax=Thermostichus vulcanus str. 'Rupite' TaxID=2813851 RepID=A0ABT0CC35_THEVL|nr:F0F1 ATP synthase subunit B' [Thermostichus vulcanus]MCJ2543267.1 F0F1 ATP synthase subunit B' [Thermostichus vulcanus str. 'Rupite']